jgi:hypothetical protein
MNEFIFFQLSPTPSPFRMRHFRHVQRVYRVEDDPSKIHGQEGRGFLLFYKLR